jgi:putative ABC transport system substrate-binding protein
MRSRRAFVIGWALGSLVSCFPALGQPRNKVRRVGFLFVGSRQAMVDSGRHQVFLNAMRERGYAVGKDFVLDERYADGQAERLRRGALELADLKADVIVATGTPAVHEARRASPTIPIVVAVTGADPVATGFAASLGRPGGNVTGLYLSEPELIPKLLELLAAVAPKMSRVAVMQNPANSAHAAQLKTARAAAERSGMSVVPVAAQTPEDIGRGFTMMGDERVDGLLVLGDGFFVQRAKQIAALALARRLPSISVPRDYALAGGLMSYGESTIENYRAAAEYVDRIFRGAKAGELPFRRSSHVDLTINRATFKALGIQVPKELALQAKEI